MSYTIHGIQHIGVEFRHADAWKRYRSFGMDIPLFNDEAGALNDHLHGR